MKIGDTVATPDGNGIIKFFEDYSRINARRVCVQLEDKSKCDGNISCYWDYEIKNSLRDGSAESSTGIVLKKGG